MVLSRVGRKRGARGTRFRRVSRCIIIHTCREVCSQFGIVPCGVSGSLVRWVRVLINVPVLLIVVFLLLCTALFKRQEGLYEKIVVVGKNDAAAGEMPP